MLSLRSRRYHPFAVEAYFRKSLVVGFVAPQRELAGLLPAPFSLDLVNEEFGFLAAAMVDTKGLRPKGMPKFTGRDFILIGYRIFARYETAAGKRRRGLYILGSETNRRSMKRLGSLFTQYSYEFTEIDWKDTPSRDSVESGSGLTVTAERCDKDADLPEGSPFSNWKEARKFAGPMPFSFSYDQAAKKVISIEGVRTGWKPQPMRVLSATVPFFEELGLSDLRVANAFLLEDIPYWWRKGEIESWPH